MLMIAFSCNVGGIATPVGTPPNLIAIGMIERIAGIEISFFEWMSFATPISVVLFLLVFFVIRRLFPARQKIFHGAARADPRASGPTLGRWSAGEQAALAAFLLAVTLWTLPGLLALVLGPEHPRSQALAGALPEGACADPRRGAAVRAARELEEAGVRAGLEAGGADRLGHDPALRRRAVAGLAGLLDGPGRGDRRRHPRRCPAACRCGLVALIALFTANFMTEVMSNTATANLLIPMFLALGDRRRHRRSAAGPPWPPRWDAAWPSASRWPRRPTPSSTAAARCR